MELTTEDTTDLVKILAKNPDATIFMVLVSVQPRNQPTGLLEEQGAWITMFWEKILSKTNNLTGCRMTWNTLFFHVIGEFDDFKLNIKNTLSGMYSTELKSIVVGMEESGDLQRRIRAVDSMQLETTSEFNFNTINQITFRLVDNQEIGE